MTEFHRKSSLQSVKFQEWTEAQYAGPDAYTGPYPTPEYTNVSWANITDGANNPLWRWQIANEMDATTTLSFSGREFKTRPGAVEVNLNVNEDRLPDFRRSAVGWGLRSFYPDPGTNAAGVEQGTADNEAAGRFYQSVRNAMSSFKGATFLAEIVETKRMIHDNASAMLQMISPYQQTLLKRFRLKRTKRGKLKTLSDSWLELQYGWLPLISDIESLNKTLNSPGLQTKRVLGQSEYTRLENLVVSGGNTFFYAYDSVASWKTKYQVKYYGSVVARPDPCGAPLSDFGLTCREFVPTLWEVIPWSFAVDYFTNISEMLTALSYAGANIAWSAATRVAERTVSYDASFRPTANSATFPEYMLVRSSPSSASVTARQIRRRSETVPIPGLRFEVPSPRQALNLAALAVSRRLRLSY
jgi:hypothetical protein